MAVAEAVNNAMKAAVKSAWVVDFALVAVVDMVVAAIAGTVSAELIVEPAFVADSAAVAAQVDMAAEEFAAQNVVEVKTHLMV